MALGEAASIGVHGANRLGSNSLLELVVFGRSAANRVAEQMTPGETHKQIKNAGEEAIARLDKMRHANGGTPTAQLRALMQKTMQNDCAVFRTSKTLAEGCANMDKVFAGKDDIRVKDRSMIWNSDLMETLEFENLILQAQAHDLLGRQPPGEPRRACARGLSRARRQELAEAHGRVGRRATGKTRIDYRPVNLQPMSNDVQSFPPKARVYWKFERKRWLSSHCPPIPRSASARPTRRRPAPRTSRRSRSIAGRRTTARTRRSTPTKSTWTPAVRWFSTR